MGTTNAPIFHEEVLTARMRSALRRLAPVAQQNGFYLAGGTAVALLLGHRRSVDLDWFCQEPLIDPALFGRSFTEQGMSVQIIQIAEGTLFMRVSGVRTSFFEYRYPLLRPPIYWQSYGCTLASLEDLACMKLLAVAQRGRKRDFVDIYAITRFIPLSEAVALYRQKYGMSDVVHLLRALTYFDDADGERMPPLRWDIRWDQIKRALTSAVKELTWARQSS